MAESQRDDLRKSFENVKYFSATSDIWSRNNISFIAVSVHYFRDGSPKKLQNKFIACEHFPGRHTNDKNALKLNAIFDRYGILERVRHVTTDNAGEYCAAFKNFGLNYRAVHVSCASAEDEDEDEVLNLLSSSRVIADDVAETSSTSNENVTLESTPDETDNESDSDDDPDKFERALSDCDDEDRDPETFYIENFGGLLPNMNRVQCSAHKFDKVGKIDAENASGTDASYDDLHSRVFTKLKAIWALKDSRVKAEIFYRITGRKLVGPHRIRWLKTCEAVCCNLQILP